MNLRLITKLFGICIATTLLLWLLTGSDASLGFGLAITYVEYKIEKIKKELIGE